MMIFALLAGLGIIGYSTRGIVRDLLDPPEAQPAPPPEEIEIEVPSERRIGEILMMPTGPNPAHYNSYAVIVRDRVAEDYYTVQTFHEVPKLYTVHTSQLLTKEELESRSRLPIEP